MKKPSNFKEYCSDFPPEVQKLLQKMHTVILKSAPGAEEVISYGMPAFKQNGMLVWFAAHSKHIGFYPRISGMEAFKSELSKYKHAKGSVQFPFDMPLPVGLIARIVKFRAKENLEKIKLKKSLKVSL